jgi:hypothetical protein
MFNNTTICSTQVELHRLEPMCDAIVLHKMHHVELLWLSDTTENTCEWLTPFYKHRDLLYTCIAVLSVGEPRHSINTNHNVRTEQQHHMLNITT